jgi:hypothetical protein
LTTDVFGETDRPPPTTARKVSQYQVRERISPRRGALAALWVSPQMKKLSSARQLPVIILVLGSKRCRTERKEKPMNRLTVLAGGVLGTLLLVGPMVRDAGAVDLTGTWSGTGAATCHGLVLQQGGTVPTAPASGKIDITLKISPATSGFDVSVDLNRTDLTDTLNGAHQYHSTFFSKTAKSNTAYGTLTQCGAAIDAGDLSGVVGSLTSSFDKVSKILSLKGTLTSGDGTSAMTCTFKGLTQTDTADPGTTCP